MSFEVDPAGLDAMQRLLDRQAEDAKAIKEYLNANGGINFIGEGLINLFRGADDAIERNIDTYFAQLATRTLPGTAAAVAGAARYYRASDTASAAKLDDSMPGANVAQAAEGNFPITFQPWERPAAFSDVAEPSGALAAVPDFNAEMPYKPTWWDFASPTSMLRDAIWAVTELGVVLGICDRTYDIFEVVLKPVVGDWAGMASTGYAMKQASEALGRVSANLDWAIQSTYPIWEGHAADAACAHLHLVRKSLTDAGVSLLKTGGEYSSAAKDAYAFSTTIGSLLCDVTDAAVAAAASAAAAGGTAATGVGVPVSLVLAGFSLTRIYKVIKAVYDILKVVADMASRIDSLIKAVDSAGGDFGMISGSFKVSLPEVPALPQ